MKHPVWILTALLVVVVAVASAPAPATAQQQQSPMVIELDPQLDMPIIDFGFGGLDALVGLTLCGTIEYPTEDRTLFVGGPGTRPECNQEWRVVTLSPRTEYAPLSNNIVLRPGQTTFVSTLMPFPAVDGPDVPPFWITLDSDFGTYTSEDITALGSLTAYIDGRNCGSRVFEAGDTFVDVPIGRPGTPEACRTPGAEIILVNAAGHQLAVRPTVASATGLFYELRDLTLDPQGRGVPGPASAGNAGLARGEDVPHGVLWLLATAAIVLLARRLTRPERR